NRVVVWHERIGVTVDRDDRRHAGADVRQRRRRPGDRVAIRLVAEPLHRVWPTLGEWFLVRSVEQIGHVGDAAKVYDGRDAPLGWFEADAIEPGAGRNEARRQREVPAG